MSTQRRSRTVLACALLATVFLAVEVMAQAPARRRGGLYGDWLVKMDVDGRQWESVLSFSRDSEGNRTAHWISLWGVREVQDLKFEEGSLSFKQVRQNREGQTMTSEFKGKIEDAKLTGTVSSERGEFELTGERIPWMPRAVGHWEVKFKVGEREITNTLVVTADKERELSIDWKSERVQHTISDVNYERGKLTFKSKAKMEDREWESSFEGTMERNSLKGMVKTEQGEMEMTGTRMGADLIGTWNLDVKAEQREFKQRLRVYPDMSARYGGTPVEKVTLEDDKVGFKIVLEFGEREFEIAFQGKLEEGKLSGELTTSMGTSKVTGTKVVRRMRRRG